MKIGMEDIDTVVIQEVDWNVQLHDGREVNFRGVVNISDDSEDGEEIYTATVFHGKEVYARGWGSNHGSALVAMLRDAAEQQG
jgi:dsRNA-specific ribonuclease